MQKWFTHIVNHLNGLGKTFDTDELNIKIPKSLNRTFQPKVTAITESHNLATMTMATLFGKLREHEHYKKTVYYRRINFDGYKSVGNLLFPTDLSMDILCEHYRRIDPSVSCILKFFIYLPTD